MISKDKNNKSTCTKNNDAPIVPIPAQIVAEMVGGSVSMVKQVRQGKKAGKGKMCQKIQMADELLTHAVNTSVEKVAEFINSQE